MAANTCSTRHVAGTSDCPVGNLPIPRGILEALCAGIHCDRVGGSTGVIKFMSWAHALNRGQNVRTRYSQLTHSAVGPTESYAAKLSSIVCDVSSFQARTGTLILNLGRHTAAQSVVVTVCCVVGKLAEVAVHGSHMPFDGRHMWRRVSQYQQGDGQRSDQHRD